MNRQELIICERSCRLASAMRLAIGRANWAGDVTPRLFGVRTFGELADRLGARPDSLAIIEAHGANLGEVLLWLADASRRYPAARFAVFADDSLTPAHGGNAYRKELSRQLVIDALREAGANEIVESTLRLQGLIAFCRRQIVRRAIRPKPVDDRSLVAQTWDSLPWQADG
jgi:hypothetical protein